MIVEHVRFNPPRRLAEYRGQAGHEASGQMLSYSALDALATAVTTKTEPEYVVVGEFRREDGARFLELGTPTTFIEANSDYRMHPEANYLRLFCPSCETWDGKHKKTCDR